MGRPGINVWWSGLLLLSLGLRRTTGEPQFLVVVPAVVESGAKVQFCFSLLQPSEDLTITVSLSQQVLHNQTFTTEGHGCQHFQAPVVEKQQIVDFLVEVRGKITNFKETRKVRIQNYEPRTFLQTDKPVYLPGQTVHFRVVTLDSKLRPAVSLYDIIEIQDRSNNRIGQWLDTSSNGTILQLSYALNSEAREGLYHLSVSTKWSKLSQTFKVEKYVLPKFSVKLKAPDEVSIGLEELRYEVCGTYTFGQSVPGMVESQVCRLPKGLMGISRGKSEPICHKELKQVDKDGCAELVVPMFPFKNDSRFLLDELYVNAIMREEGTDIKHPVEQKIKISYKIGTVTFVDPPQLYTLGSVVHLKVKAVHHNDTPVSDTVVYLIKASNQVIDSLRTDKDGFVRFALNTSAFPREVTLKVSLYQEYFQTYKTPYFSDAFHHLSEAQPPTAHTKTVSSVEVKAKDKHLDCGSEEDFSIEYTVVGELKGTMHLMYVVLSRGSIIKYGHQSVEIKNEPVLEGQLKFQMMVSPEMAPALQIVAYAVLPSENVIANARDFDTDKCFINQVQLEFSPSSSVPGEDSTLKVSALPHSLCGVSAVDQSVHLKEPGKALNKDRIFSLLPVQKAQSFSSELEDESLCRKVRHRRMVMNPPHMYDRDSNDAYAVFKGRGLKVATNLFIRTPWCLNFRGTQFYQNHYHPYGGYGYGYRYSVHSPHLRLASAPRGPMGPTGTIRYYDSPPPPPPPPPIETVRTFFPETWIWDLLDTGESGSSSLTRPTPDSITTWETEAFCLSSVGFGLAPRKELTVFQPFFLELTLPYSIIRGESFTLKATVFNYLRSCIMISVVATLSLDYTLTPLSGQYTSCLCGNERKTLSWTMVPSALGSVNVSVSAEAITSDVPCDNEIISVPERGRIDVVTKTLIVKAEGTEMTTTHNWLLCPNGEALQEEVELQLPEKVIPGSARASVSVLGDILGRAMKNLDGLLKMPYGCGEQNMALLAPNIYILQYLQNTDQLTPAIRQKANPFLTSGYQRQLNYKHSDGAYSTFGRGDGNTWLTAFVVRSLVKAQSFVYIDPEKVHQSRAWLQRQQKEDGCFRQSGKLFNNRMKGGVSDEVTLSAYITAAFLEMNMSVTNPVVNRSLSCLRNHSQSLENIYTTALMAYVFSLAKDTETRSRLLQKLTSEGQEEGGFVHWSSSDPSSSLSVETSSYVLLSTLTQASVSAEDLGYASRIVRWLTLQQNPYGGFTSTQDTVVALQALSLYSTLVFSPTGSSLVSVRSPSSSMTFDLNPTNKLLYQERPLRDVSGTYSLEVTGSACASVQISVHYNVPTPTDTNTLKVEVQEQMDCGDQRPALRLNLTSLFSGEQSSTNMVILDVKVLSGFTPDRRALRNLESEDQVDRVEENGDHILIYLRELEKDQSVSHELRLEQEMVVHNLKPAVVKIYDYYQPSDQAETEYSSPCAAPQQ